MTAMAVSAHDTFDMDMALDKTPGSLMSSQLFATTPNGTAVLSPNTPMEADASDSLLSFLEDPQWNKMEAQVMSAAQRPLDVVTKDAKSSNSSGGTFVDDMDIISPKGSSTSVTAAPAPEVLDKAASRPPVPPRSSTVSVVKREGAAAPEEILPPDAIPARASRHRRSASAPAHLLTSVLGKRKPVKSPPPPAARSTATKNKGRAAKLSKARKEGATEHAGRPSFDSIEEEAPGSGIALSFGLKQGKEGSRDQGKKNAHPTWIRSNMRATWGHLTMQCESLEESAALEALLRDGEPYEDYASASVEFAMLYDNGEPVELLEKKGGNLADRVKLILPNGNVEQGITMADTTIAYHTDQGGSKQWVKAHYLQFDAARFPWNSDKRSRSEPSEEAVEIGLKFATNVTTRAHNKRRFMWRVDLRLYGASGAELAHHSTCSPPFAYLPRNPEKSTQDFRLDDVVTDGHPGELLFCGGSGLGCKERPQLVAVLRAGKGEGLDYTLPRQSVTKSTFVARLPPGVPPGVYTVQLVNEENPDEVTEEVKTKVLEETLEPCLELDEFTQQFSQHLAAEAQGEALSRGNSSNNCSEDEDGERLGEEAWAVR